MIAGGERPMLGFETLTLAPIDRRLVVDGAADAPRSVAQLDAYHARVLAVVGPHGPRRGPRLAGRGLRAALSAIARAVAWKSPDLRRPAAGLARFGGCPTQSQRERPLETAANA